MSFVGARDTAPQSQEGITSFAMRFLDERRNRNRQPQRLERRISLYGTSNPSESQRVALTKRLVRRTSTPIRSSEGSKEAGRRRGR